MLALETRDLTVHYGNQVALWDLSVSVPTGRMCAIVGPNGAGKSTLLKAMVGVVRPFAGQVSILGEPLAKVRRKVAFVPQRSEVDWSFPVTVLDVVLMGGYGRLGWIRRPGRRQRLAAMEALEQVEMAPFAHRQIEQLSGGQQQRVFLARALFQQAEVYLLDEPFAGVDMATEKLVVDLLGQLSANGKSVLVVHHDLATVRSYYDWVVLLNMRLIGSGPVDEIFDSDHLSRAYGKSHLLFEEALKRSNEISSGA